MVIYKDVHVIIEHKIWHGVRRHHVFKPSRRSFCRDYGDVPDARFNEVTGKLEDVVNTRGNAYAARNRKSYRRISK